MNELIKMVIKFTLRQLKFIIPIFIVLGLLIFIIRKINEPKNNFYTENLTQNSAEVQKSYQEVANSAVTETKRNTDIDNNQANQIPYNNIEEAKLQRFKVAVEFNFYEVKDFANSLIEHNPGVSNLTQYLDVFDYLKKRHHYISDPELQNDYVLSAYRFFSKGYNGDCDDFSVCIASLVFAIGGDVRIVTAHTADTGHAYTEVSVDDLDKVYKLLYKRYDSMFGSLFDGATVETFYYHNDQANPSKKWISFDFNFKYPGEMPWASNKTVAYYPFQNRYEDISNIPIVKYRKSERKREAFR